MHRLLPLLLVGLLISAASAQEFAGGLDLLYPEFAHPREDAASAIERRDFRFINVDRHGKIVPGTEDYPRLVTKYGVKFVRQRFRIFASPSQNFSFALRARAYALEYNWALLHYLLRHPQK